VAETAAFEPDYRALVAAAGDIIYTLNLEGRITSMNPAADPRPARRADGTPRKDGSRVVEDGKIRNPPGKK
jgi:hypothetical protein